MLAQTVSVNLYVVKCFDALVALIITLMTLTLAIPWAMKAS